MDGSPVEQAEFDRRVAAEIFQAGLTAATSSIVWSDAMSLARKQVLAALDASRDLRDVTAALATNGRHMETFRYLMAPPASQDRFQILCQQFSKSKEKSGSPFGEDDASAIASVLSQWFDQSRIQQISQGGTSRDLAVEVTAALMAHRAASTGARTATSKAQEELLIDVLVGAGWRRQTSTPIRQHGDVLPGHFMHKPRMANAGGLEQEVDVAIGLPGGRTLAIECKASNDETNSIKRANDVLNKVRAWQLHWGNFVVTGAFLQGVFARNDVRKLVDQRVQLFWAHSVGDLADWLTAESERPPR